MQQAVKGKIGTSRGWTLAFGIGAAVLAAILLIAYLVQYRSSVNARPRRRRCSSRRTSSPRARRGRSSPRRSSSRSRRLPKDDLKVGAISDPGVPERPRRGRGHLPRAADHDRRPERRPHRRDPDAALGKQRAVAIPVDAAPAASSATSRSGDRVDIYFETGASGGTMLGLLAPERARHAGARRGRRQPDVLRRRRRPRAEARARLGHGHPVVPPPPGRRRQERRRRRRSPATLLLGAVDPGQEVDDRWTRSSAHSLPSKAWTPSTSSGRCPTTRTSSSSGSRRRRRDRPHPAEPGRRRAPRRLPGPRGRPVAPDHRQRAPDRIRACRSSSSRRRRPTGSSAGRSTPARRTWRCSRSRRSSSGSSMSKAIARAPRERRGGGERSDGRARLRARPEGRHGQDADVVQPRGRARARRAKRSLVIDLDLQFGDVGLCLGLPPEKTMYDLAISGGSLDADKLARLRDDPRHGRRGPARAGAARPGERDHDRAAPRRPRRRARRRTTSSSPTRRPGFTAEVIATIDASSDLVMVGTLDSLSLKNTKLGLETLGLMDYDPKKIQLVLNRADTRVGHQPARRRRRARERAQHLHPLRPRDPALGQRGHPDHPVAARSRTPRRRSTTSPRSSPTDAPNGAEPVAAGAAAARRRVNPDPCSASEGSSAWSSTSDSSRPSRRPRSSAEGAVRRPQELDPHARDQRARPAADGPGDRPGRDARPRHRGHPPAPLGRDGYRPRRPRAPHERDRRRHPRLRAARAPPRRRLDHGDHGQRPGRDLDRASGPALRDDRALQRRLAPAPHHQPDGRADRPPHRRVVADGRRPPPRRLARQRDHRAALALGAAAHDPQVLAQAPRAAGHGQHRLAQRGVGRLPAALHHGAAERPHLGRYGLGQDDAAERALVGDPGQRADRHDRGRGRAPAAPAARAPARGAPAEHRGRGRDPDPRPRAELAAHAPRPDHRRRVPWPARRSTCSRR